MSYIQTMTLKKSGSDWDFTSEAVADLQKDLDDTDFVSGMILNTKITEQFTLDDADQILTIKRTWNEESDYQDHKKIDLSSLENKLAAAGWTVTES